MAGRYSRMFGAVREKVALDNYIKYMTDFETRAAASKVGTGKTQPKSQVAHVLPFGLTLGTGQYAHSSGNQATITEIEGDLGTHIHLTLATGEQALRLVGFKAARIKIWTGKQTEGTKEFSKKTTLPYLNYGGKHTSAPFGKASATGTETEQQAFNTIQTSVATTLQGAIISLQPEVVHAAT